MPSRYGLAIIPNKFLLFLIGYKIARVNKSHRRAGDLRLSSRQAHNLQFEKTPGTVCLAMKQTQIQFRTLSGAISAVIIRQ
jgi:hypothetical protein